jgi:hypothetical protein
VTSCSTASPPIVLICIGANWKMSVVMSHDSKYEAAGDLHILRGVHGAVINFRRTLLSLYLVLIFLSLTHRRKNP